MLWMMPKKRSATGLKKMNKLKISIVFALIFLFANAAFAQVTPENRLKIFNQVWETINQKYYDDKFNGVDWKKVREDYRPKVETAKSDDEFYGLIKEMVRELQDAHTRFWTPKEAELKKKKQFSSIGLRIEEVDGKIVTASVQTGSDEEKAGITAGMIVNSVDGQNVSERLDELKQTIKSSSAQAVKVLSLRALFRGEVGSVIKLNLTNSADKTLEVSLTRRIFNQSFDVVSRKLSDNLGYVKFDTFDDKLSDKLKTAISNLKETQGLIIDLRDNGGGQVNFVEKVAGWLVNKKTSFGKAKWRGKEPKEIFVGDKGSQIYSSPIVILVDKDSASGSELLAIGLQESERAKVVGSTSCGCLLGIAGAKEIKDGELEFSQIGFISAKNFRVETNGITPDLVVNLNLNDYREKSDRTLAEAIKFLLLQKPTK
jgi:carboxyl-terminal processing protease